MSKRSRPSSAPGTIVAPHNVPLPLVTQPLMPVSEHTRIESTMQIDPALTMPGKAATIAGMTHGEGVIFGKPHTISQTVDTNHKLDHSIKSPDYSTILRRQCARKQYVICMQ